MITKDNWYINEKAICWIRHIKKLAPGYYLDAYTKYAAYSHTHFANDLTKDIKKIDLSKFFCISDCTPDKADNVPGNSQIDYYINLCQVYTAVNFTDTWGMAPYITISFLSGYNLTVYNTEVFKTLIEALERENHIS